MQPSASSVFVSPDPFASLHKEGSPWKFPHLQESNCCTVNLSISASIGKKCVKGPCQDTIAALWACNVRPSIGTHRTMGALEKEKYNQYSNFMSGL